MMMMCVCVCCVQYDGELSSHYSSMDGITSPVYDPATAAAVTAGHHAARAGPGPGSLPLQPSAAAAALPRSPAYSPHPSAAGAVSSLASPYSAGYSGSTSAAMNAASSSAAAVAAVDSLLKRDKDAIYRRADSYIFIFIHHYGSR